MQNGVTVDIKIQSISDLITNSSSEVFCTIAGDKLKEIGELLDPMFGGDSDLCPSLYYGENSIEIWIPYHLGEVTDFYKAGLEAILDQYFGDTNYTINYEY